MTMSSGSSNSNQRSESSSLCGVGRSVKDLATTPTWAQTATMSMTPTKLKVSKDVSKSLDNLKSENEKKALHAINVLLPEKLLKLDQLLAESPLLNFDHPEGVIENVDVLQQQSNGEPLNPLKHGIPANSKLAELLKILKKEVREGIQIVSSIKIWITMLIPKMEDGNNFGVAVQEEVNNALDEVESRTYNVLEGCQKYHQLRAKYVEKTLKHPHIDDFRRAIIERDQIEWMSRRNAIIDLRNNYATLFDMITKNLDKVTKPKGDNDGDGRITYM